MIKNSNTKMCVLRCYAYAKLEANREDRWCIAELRRYLPS